MIWEATTRPMTVRLWQVQAWAQTKTMAERTDISILTGRIAVKLDAAFKVKHKISEKGFFFVRGVGGSPPTPLTIKNQVVKGNL